MRVVNRLLVCLALFALVALQVSAKEIPQARPKNAGFKSSKLKLAKAAVQEMVDKKQIAGAVVIVARHGKVVQLEAVGKMDIEAGKAMRPDAIFRIYSMSKPITTVAAMILWEEGRFKLDDPVAKYLPELKDVKILKVTGKDSVEVAVKKPMTIRDLMRHTSGLSYGFLGNPGVDKLYQDRKILDPNTPLAGMITKLGKLPLLSEPGTRFNYSVSTDVLGRLVEVISGQTLDTFFQKRIFEPLDMKDTGFFVPKDKLDRFCANYGPGKKGGLEVIDAPAKSAYRALPKFLSGGGGLVSTARDYLRFCQMLASGGKLHGKRLLKMKTVKQMTANQLPKEAMPLTLGVARPGVGFGLGFSVRVEASKSEPAAVVGEYGWGGAASTHFWISPKHNLVVVTLQQYMPFSPRMEQALKPLIYGAIAK